MTTLQDLSSSYFQALIDSQHREPTIQRQQFTGQSTKGTQSLGTQDTVTTTSFRRFFDSKDSLLLPRRRFIPDDAVEFCPYIGIAGGSVDLHTTELFTAKDHVGVKPKQSPGSVFSGGPGEG